MTTLTLENHGNHTTKTRIENQFNIDVLIDKINSKYQTVGWKVDLQEDFMNDGSRENYVGKLAIKDGLSITPKIRKVENAIRMYGKPIMGSMDWHDKNSKEFARENEEPDYKKTYPEHCVAGTKGAEFIKEARPKNALYINWNEKYDLGELTNKILNHEGEIIFQKDAFDVFNPKGNKYTGEIIKQLGIKNALVYGVALEVCNNYAIEGLIERGVTVYAITDAMKAIDEKNRSLILEQWQDKGVNIINSDQIYSVLESIKVMGE